MNASSSSHGKSILAVLVFFAFSSSLLAAPQKLASAIPNTPNSRTPNQPKSPKFLVPKFLQTDLPRVGSQVVAADLNLDGRVDLAFMTSKGLQIFLGTGNGSFKAYKRYGLKENNFAIAVGDMNSDGIPDLVVTNSTPGCPACIIQVLLGNGNGSFRFAGTAPVNRAQQIATADLNHDGNLDLVVTQGDNQHQDSRLAVFLGKGDGTLGNEVEYYGGEQPSSVVLGDFNQDGKIDIVEGGGDGTHLLYGNGDGTFQPALLLHRTNGGQVALADFNSDGLPDIVTQSSTGVTVLLNEGNNKLKVVESDSGGLSGSFAVGDFNNDGKLDIVMDGLGIMFGRGDGSFRTPTTFYSDSNIGDIIAADLNGDHNLDVVQVSYFYTPDGLLLMFGNGTGALQAQAAFGTNGYNSSFAVGDFNNDGKTDAAVLDFNDGFTATMSLLLGNGNGKFQAPLPSFRVGGIAIAAGDFDHDNNLDLIILSGLLYGDNVLLYRGNGDGTFQSPLTISAGIGDTIAMAVADLNHDGKLDLAVASRCNDEQCHTGGVSILLGNGDGTFQPPAVYGISYPANSIVAADFNNDGVPDLATANQASVTVLLNNGDGTFQPSTTVNTGGAATSIIAADFNGDRNQDLAFQYTSQGPAIDVMLGLGNGSFGAPITISPGVYQGAIVQADFNGDGKPDIAGFSSVGGVWVYSGIGDGTFMPPVVLPQNTRVRSISPAFLRNNTFPDILVGTDQTYSLGVMLNLGK